MLFRFSCSIMKYGDMKLRQVIAGLAPRYDLMMSARTLNTKVFADYTVSPIVLFG